MKQKKQKRNPWPWPPSGLRSIAAGGVADHRFEPGLELRDWALDSFVREGAALENPDHAHLREANIGMVWTNRPNTRHGRTVLGQAELCPTMVSAGQWVKGRLEFQLAEWFGSVPDFLVTVFAPYAAECSATTFCALIEHELYHCGQRLDEYGMPKFHKDGTPVYAMRGHDVEEFVGVVRRYGTAESHTRELVLAGAKNPEIGLAAINGWCGNCIRAAA